MLSYLCQQCQQIVKLDLALDEVKSSSTSAHFKEMERTLKILVADDSELILRMATDLLSEAGFKVVTAGDGATAMRRIEEEHPDLVVLDLLMPKMTGFDVLREIRQDERLKSTPVLIMSGVYKEDVVSHLWQMGASGFMDKDLLTDSLVFRVRSLLETQAA
ncbi:MAG TPA: response regulator [Candidatus Saccharimonadales bacterium]|nr:response regulator [Candidatus Saccharimonadales bacterium]